MWFLNRPDKNQAAQSQKQARSSKFWIYSTICVAKTKALISFAVAKLICVFVFAYADCWYSHEVAHLLFMLIQSFFSSYAGRESTICPMSNHPITPSIVNIPTNMVSLLSKRFVFFYDRVNNSILGIFVFQWRI